MSFSKQLIDLQSEVRVSLLSEAAKEGKIVAEAVEVCLRAPTTRHLAVLSKTKDVYDLYLLWEDLENTIHTNLRRVS